MIHDPCIIQIYAIMVAINANKYFEISLYTQQNPKRLGQSCDHLQEFKIDKLGTLKANKMTFQNY